MASLASVGVDESSSQSADSAKNSTGGGDMAGSSLSQIVEPLEGNISASVDFTGVWKESSLHNLEAFLVGMGIGWIKRKAAIALLKLKTQTQTVYYDETAQTVQIKVVGKPSGDEENLLSIGRPTVVKSKDSNDNDNELTLNLKWNDDKTILINDFIAEGGRLIVKRYMVGKQMKVECCHFDSGKIMWRMFDKVDTDKRVTVGDDGKLILA